MLIKQTWKTQVVHTILDLFEFHNSRFVLIHFNTNTVFLRHSESPLHLSGCSTWSHNSAVNPPTSNQISTRYLKHPISVVFPRLLWNSLYLNQNNAAVSFCRFSDRGWGGFLSPGKNNIWFEEALKKRQGTPRGGWKVKHVISPRHGSPRLRTKAPWPTMHLAPFNASQPSLVLIIVITRHGGLPFFNIFLFCFESFSLR